ncbi:hypothetical protein W911_14620 [Hyphomicrobium nitrativorans NL23]|uniref:Uncharacterized protein n=1 Tax=Hyphomicrobium nitrativorans NL23 TaxID=1029756 RepID=V5SHL6_9HYPH|nr:hypothetical protein [Hyphomicrobium nitrativorans]AHB50346.1 hypothetical protein W911_14620 [Hyphomicrobium nitrativorans NL23]
MIETVSVTMRREGGMIEVVDGLRRVLGRGLTVDAALQDAALQHSKWNLSLGAIVVGTDHLGQPLAEMTVARRALHFRMD